jgi:hypothetical protein
VSKIFVLFCASLWQYKKILCDICLPRRSEAETGVICEALRNAAESRFSGRFFCQPVNLRYLLGLEKEARVVRGSVVEDESCV